MALATTSGKNTNKTKKIKKKFKNTNENIPKNNNPAENPTNLQALGECRLFPLLVLRPVHSRCIFPIRRTKSRNPLRSSPVEVPHCRRGAEHGTHWSMGRCKLPCLPCQLWKQKPALKNAATTLTLPLEKHSMALEKPALLQHCFHQMDTGTAENTLSTWNMNVANVSFRHLFILSFHPSAEMVTSFL